MRNGLYFDLLFGAVASVIAVAAGTYVFMSPFTNDEIMRNFVTSTVASFVARKLARQMKIRVNL